MAAIPDDFIAEKKRKSLTLTGIEIYGRAVTKKMYNYDIDIALSPSY